MQVRRESENKHKRMLSLLPLELALLRVCSHSGPRVPGPRCTHRGDLRDLLRGLRSAVGHGNCRNAYATLRTGPGRTHRRACEQWFACLFSCGGRANCCRVFRQRDYNGPLNIGRAAFRRCSSHHLAPWRRMGIPGLGGEQESL
jgi:hypothetical protein